MAEKQELGGIVSLALTVREADGLLTTGAKVRITDDNEVGVIDAAGQLVLGYVLVANREAGGEATIATRGYRVNNEDSGAAFAAGDLLGVDAQGRVVLGSASAATADLTVVDFTWSGGETITINGVAITEGTDFTAGTSNAATALSIADAINSRIPGVQANAAAAVVTVAAHVPGAAGNAITVATTAVVGDMTLSGAVLSGGLDFYPMAIALAEATGADESTSVLWLL